MAHQLIFDIRPLGNRFTVYIPEEKSFLMDKDGKRITFEFVTQAWEHLKERFPDTLVYASLPNGETRVRP